MQIALALAWQGQAFAMQKKCEASRYAGFCEVVVTPPWSPFIWAAGRPSGSVLPIRQQSADHSLHNTRLCVLAYLVLLRVEIARFTRT